MSGVEVKAYIPDYVNTAEDKNMAGQGHFELL